jgi:hypothetical protein
LVSNGHRTIISNINPIKNVTSRAAVLLAALALAMIINPANANVPESRLAILSSGVNLTTVFPEDYRPLQLLPDMSKDIRAIRAQRFKHIRIMVNPLWVNQWDDHLQRLDAAVRTALNEHLGVILCLNAPKLGQLVASDDDAITPQWLAAWQRLAGRYAPASTDYIFFELANEPQVKWHWSALQEQLRAVVRQVAPLHTLILTGSPNSTPQALASLPVSIDENVVYAFHLYKPMVFTHQAAEWAKPRYGKVHGLPYPPTVAIDPQNDDSLLMQELTGYKRWGGNVIRSEISLVATWAQTHHVHVIATEFGVFRRSTPVVSRGAWLGEVHRATHEAGIGSTVWEYRGGFGIESDLEEGCYNPVAQGLGVCP